MKSKEAASPWKDRTIQAALVAAVAIRLAFVVLAFYSAPSSRRYIEPAQDILHGHFFSDALVDQLPGAPLFFAAVIAVFGEDFSRLAVAQHLLGLATLALLILTAWREWGLRAARWAAWLVVLQFILPYQECLMLSESVAEFFLVATMFLVLSARRDAGLRTALFAGLAAGSSALSRGELIFIGPLSAAFLAVVSRKAKAPAALFGGWLLLVGGWRVHNGMAGFAGFNAHGPTCLLDGPGADALVRHDLPTYALAKRLLLEEDQKCAGRPGCSGRLHVFERLQKEYGYSYLRTMQEVGDMSAEAWRTQPGKFLPIFLQNFRLYLRPGAWVDEDLYEPESPIRDYEDRGGANAAFWRAMAAGPQYLGWLVFVFAGFSAFVLFGKFAGDRRAPAYLWAVVFCVIGTASIFREVARTQAQLLLPLGLLGGFAVAAWKERRRPQGR